MAPIFPTAPLPNNPQPPTAHPPTYTHDPYNPPAPHIVAVSDHVQWDTHTDVYTNLQTGATLKGNNFKQGINPNAPKLTWTPDNALANIKLKGKSLNAKSMAAFQAAQQILGQMHLMNPWPPGTTIPIYYKPPALQPHGLAGYDAITIQLEGQIKELLVADRYATPHPSAQTPSGLLANTNLATMFRQEQPEKWHLPLTDLFEHTDLLLKRYAQAHQIGHHFKAPPTLDKATTRALTTLPTNTVRRRDTPNNRDFSRDNTRDNFNNNQRTTERRNNPSQYTSFTPPLPTPPESLPPPNSNYHGKRYDPNFVHPNARPRPSGGANRGPS